VITVAYGRYGAPNRTGWRSAGSPVCLATAFEYFGARVSSIPFYSGRAPREWAGDAWPKWLTPPIPLRETRGRRGSLLLHVMTRCVQWDYPGPVEVRKVFSYPSPVSLIHACCLESRVPRFLRPESPVVESGGEPHPVQRHEILVDTGWIPSRGAFSVESVAWETACVNLKAKFRRIAC